MSVHPEVPELVTKALRAAWSRGYVHATRTETGRVLATLAASRKGTLAECGCGCGVGAAWLRTGAPDATRVVTAAGNDPDLVTDARDVFTGEGIDVLASDWSHLHEQGPLSMLVLDADCARRADREALLELLAPGGMIVIDDLIPCHGWPPRDSRGIDVMRVEWLTDPRLASAEILVAEDAAVLVAVRR
ncbi:MAG: cytidine deaminase [Propionibacteriaceae bacterium]|nr:cytidine deaminase [Propionibacteriaceae bacterium]